MSPSLPSRRSSSRAACSTVYTLESTGTPQLPKAQKYPGHLGDGQADLLELPGMAEHLSGRIVHAQATVIHHQEPVRHPATSSMAWLTIITVAFFAF